jgi:hypothetical protein
MTVNTKKCDFCGKRIGMKSAYYYLKLILWFGNKSLIERDD